MCNAGALVGAAHFTAQHLIAVLHGMHQRYPRAALLGEVGPMYTHRMHRRVAGNLPAAAGRPASRLGLRTALWLRKQPQC